MRRLLRVLMGAMAVVVVLALVVVGVRLVNGWRFDQGQGGPDPRAISSYDLEQEGMSVEHVTGDYLAGFHLRPDEVTRDGVVVTFGGSEGSPDYLRAVELAQQGHEVYSLFFFGQDNQQSDLERVPLEFFAEVLTRIEDTSARPGPLTVIGSSKGAELAVLLAEDYEEIDNVVLFAPSAHAYQALSFGAEPVSSWTRDGQDVPFLSFQDASLGALAGQLSALAFNYPVAYRSTYETVAGGAEPADEEAARLDASQVTGALLVFAGGDDEMWPSDLAAEQLAEQNPEAEVHVYPGAGHVFAGEGHVGGMALGGTAEANEEAGQESTAVLHERLATWHG